MTLPWKTPEGWSRLACEIAWYDFRSRLDFDTCDGVVLSVNDWGSLNALRERLHDLPGATDGDLTAALKQIGAVPATSDDRDWWRELVAPDNFWSWPDADTAMRAWRAVGAMPDPADAWAEAIAIVESEPEYPDADAYFSQVKDALVEFQFEHPELVFKMLVQVARGAVQDTKRCIAERMRKAAGIENTDIEEGGR